MMRERITNFWCRKCEQPLHLGRKDCPCMLRMTEPEAVRHRVENWYPAYVKITVSMETANR